MRTARYKDEVDALLKNEDVITVADFVSVCPDMPKASIYARIRSLEKAGRIHTVGRGRYLATEQIRYKTEVTTWMKELNLFLISNCPGVNHCVFERDGNLVVEVGAKERKLVLETLSNHYDKVVMREDADRFPGKLDKYIIVGKLVSDSPVDNEEGIPVPSLEKQLVDTLSSTPESANQSFRKAFDVYSVNLNKLNRYAARRGLSEELESCLSSLNGNRIKMFENIRKYLASIPVAKAWVFGSFSRGEETDGSDLDLLVSYDNNARLSLLTIVRWKLDLEKITGREVDLVEDGFLKPFAVTSANNDKYLIYERKN